MSFRPVGCGGVGTHDDQMLDLQSRESFSDALLSTSFFVSPMELSAFDNQQLPHGFPGGLRVGLSADRRAEDVGAGVERLVGPGFVDPSCELRQRETGSRK